jgi:MFS family permease
MEFGAERSKAGRPNWVRGLAYWLAGGGLMLLMMGTNVPSPLYGVYRQEWGFSAGVLTLIFASYVAALIPSLLVFGRLSDEVGRRRTVLIGLLVAVCGAALFFLAQGVAWLFAARAVQGVAVGLTSGAATAAIAELHSRGNRRAAALLTTVALTGGSALGPLFGGLVAQYGPGPLALPYLAYLCLLIPAMLSLWAVMPETVEKRLEGKPVTASLRPRLPRVSADILGSFALGSSACFVGWAVTGLFLALVPSYVAELLGLSNLAVGGGAVFAMLGASTLAQLFMKRTSHRRAMVLGSLALVAGLGLLVLSVPTHSLWPLFGSTLLDGFGLGLAFMGGLGLVGKVAPSENRAEVLSACYVVIYLGVGLPVVGVGFASGWIGLFAAVMAFAAVVGALCLPIAYAAARMPEHS